MWYSIVVLSQNTASNSTMYSHCTKMIQWLYKIVYFIVERILVYNKILCRTDLLIMHETLYISSSDCGIIRVIVQQPTSLHRSPLIFLKQIIKHLWSWRCAIMILYLYWTTMILVYYGIIAYKHDKMHNLIPLLPHYTICESENNHNS